MLSSRNDKTFSLSQVWAMGIKQVSSRIRSARMRSLPTRKEVTTELQEAKDEKAVARSMIMMGELTSAHTALRLT